MRYHYTAAIFMVLAAIALNTVNDFKGWIVTMVFLVYGIGQLVWGRRKEGAKG